MGYLLNGVWNDGWYDTAGTAGEFVRPDAKFRSRVTADGSSGYPEEVGRCHLYVSLACPWAHRTLIFHKLKNFEAAISVSIVEPVMSSEGWSFSATLPDRINGFSHLHQLYAKTEPRHSGRVTVPVLWDKERNLIINNESAEIIRMLNIEFAAYVPLGHDYYPVRLHSEIDDVKVFVYNNINNGVYRCGFASTQAAYESAARRLFTTLIHFDAVYHGHFKCNLRRIEDYPALSAYLRDLYQMPGIAETVDLDHIKRHYYMSHEHINPTRIVPLGPELDFRRLHDCERFACN